MVLTSVDIIPLPVWQDVIYTDLTSRLAEAVYIMLCMTSRLLLSVAKLSLSLSSLSPSSVARKALESPQNDVVKIVDCHVTLD